MKANIYKLFCAFMLFSLAAAAQQIPLFSTYTFNKFLVNPAFTGIDNEYRAFGFYRSQWGGLPGRPVTGGATFEGAFWKDRIGAGAQVINDQIGIFNQMVANISYAQKLTFAKEHQIAIGIQGGIQSNRIDFSNAQAKDGNDPGIGDARTNKVVFDMSAGISYKWRHLIIGFSVPNILQPNSQYAISGGSETSFQYLRHYTALAQYKISIAHDKFGITPTVFMRKSAGSNFQLDATALFDYKNMIFAGGGYRSAYGLTGIVGVNIIDLFTVAYAYDYTTQPVLNGNVGATHEVTFGFHISTHYKKRKEAEYAANVQSIPPVPIAGQLLNNNDSITNALNKAKEELDNANKEAMDLNKENMDLQQQVDSLYRAQEKEKQLQQAVHAITSVKGTNEQSFTLDKIFFEFTKYNLLPESKSQLDSLANFLKLFPSVNISVNGYSDNVGNDEVNQKLSEERANAVTDYLIAQGIDAKRLVYKGYGKEKPVASNSTEEGRKLNRRVEFVILNK